MPHDQESTKTAGVRRVAAWMLGVCIMLLVGALLVRVFIRPVPPGQPAPTGHFGEPCWACHLVTDSIEPAEVP